MRAKSFSIIAMALAAGTASAQVTITQTNAAAPTYATTLNFDEAGGPTGNLVGNEFAGIGISNIMGGGGPGNVDDWDTIMGGWGLGSGNSIYGSFGVFIEFSSDLSEFSTQYWDTSGPASPFGGGMAMYAFNDGAEVGSVFTSPAYGGLGDSWFNITTAGGAVFDEVRILGWGFPADGFADNLSWNAVPSPASAGLLGLGGLVAMRRRR